MADVRSIIGAAGLGVFAADALNLYDRMGRDAARMQQRLWFPLDLKADVPYMSMQFSAYKRRSIYQQPFYQPEMRIRLPVPENLTERTSISYDNTNLNSVTGASVEAAAGTLSNQGGTFAQDLAGILSGAGATVAGAAAARAGVGSGVPTALSALSGITTNPFQIVLFKSPDFRSHSFSWRFVPTNKGESDMINDIVETFRYHSLPGISAAAGVLFSYPEILEISFGPADNYLYKFKPCVVKDISVNFAPNGPSFYRSTNAPAAVHFTINVQEIEIWTKADWDRNSLRVGPDAGRLTTESTLGPTLGGLFENIRRNIRENVGGGADLGANVPGGQ